MVVVLKHSNDFIKLKYDLSEYRFVAEIDFDIFYIKIDLISKDGNCFLIENVFDNEREVLVFLGLFISQFEDFNLYEEVIDEV